MRVRKTRKFGDRREVHRELRDLFRLPARIGESGKVYRRRFVARCLTATLPASLLDDDALCFACFAF